jgi:hypothetical protein
MEGRERSASSAENAGGRVITEETLALVVFEEDLELVR